MSELSNINFIPKISGAKMGLDQETVRDACKTKQAPLYRVYGTVNKAEYGSSDNGDWTKFRGMFEAINTQTGEVFRSGNMFLPPAVTPILEGMVIIASKEEGFSGLQFAFEVQAKRSKVPIGYEYAVKNLMGNDMPNDPLVAMRKVFSLPAPAGKK